MPDQHDFMKIGYLLSDLTQLGFEYEPELGFRSDWQPVSPEGKQVFDQLVATENRESLRSWYSRFQGLEMNPTGANLKASLERAICEKLG